MRNTYLKTKDLNGKDVYINPLAVALVHHGQEDGVCAVIFYGRERELWIKEDHTEVAKLCRKFCEKSPITWGVERTPTGKNVAVLRRAPPQFSPDLSRIEFSCSPWDKKESLLEQSILFLGQAYHKNLSQITTSEVEAIITETPISELISGAEIVDLGSNNKGVALVFHSELGPAIVACIKDLVRMVNNSLKKSEVFDLVSSVEPGNDKDLIMYCSGISRDVFDRLTWAILNHPQTSQVSYRITLKPLQGDTIFFEIEH